MAHSKGENELTPPAPLRIRGEFSRYPRGVGGVNDVSGSALCPSSLDVKRLRQDFPILRQKIYGKPLVYLDNAATTQKPLWVIDVLNQYYSDENANIHRGIHFLSERATQDYEAARGKVQRFIHAKEVCEIVFVRGTTEAINLVAQSFGRTFLKAGDEILISAMEHHSNIVPWQMLCEQMGAKLRVIPINKKGELLLEEYERLLNARTKLVSIVHVSNALGTVNPVQKMIQMAHAKGIPVLVDGAQAVAHLKVDVQVLDADFYVFSGHKIYGPTGIGVLYGKKERLEKMPPYQGGGDMISRVTFEKTLYNVLPYKFEAGTPHVAGAIGLGAALDYIRSVGLEAIAVHEKDLVTYGVKLLLSVPTLRLVGEPSDRAGIVSFVFDLVHAHDVGTVLDRAGVALRAGHHCTMPLMDFLGVPATVRASFALYNTRSEIDVMVEALGHVTEIFG
ncbi:MAG: cysteine desulfurase [Chlamydiae bacterium]|nr:cysteine desulfurase [Chlamydiota bacterium]